MYYNTTENKTKVYSDSAWSDLGGVSGLWTQTDSDIYYNTGNVGIGTTTPSEKLEVAGNIKLSGASPTYKITNLVTGTANTDAATKGYVDAITSATLNVYKNDGETLLGILAGPWDTAPTICTGWGFWKPAGGLHVLSASDCPPGQYMFLYDGDNCSGNAYLWFPNIYGTDSVKCGLSAPTTTPLTLRSYRSAPNTTCYAEIGSGYNFYKITFSTCTPALCGETGPCKVK